MTTVFVIGALLSSFLSTTTYTATALLLIEKNPVNQLLVPSSALPDPSRAVATAIGVLESDAVQRRVALRYPRPSEVHGASSGNDDIVEVRVTNRSALKAATLANAYAAAFIDLRERQEAAQFRQTASDLQAQSNAVGRQLSALDRAVAAAAPARRQAVEQALASQRQALLNAQATFRQRIDEMDVGAAAATGGASVLAKAAVPTSPAQPSPVHSAVIAGLVGLVLGIGVALIVDYSDDRIRTADDVGALGLPYLGAIPYVRSKRRRPSPSLSELSGGDSAEAREAFNALRARVEFEESALLGVSVILVVGSTEGEGASTISVNLASRLAAVGRSSIFVDLDLRKHDVPSLEQNSGEGGLPASPQSRMLSALRPGEFGKQTHAKTAPRPGPLIEHEYGQVWGGSSHSAAEYESLLSGLSSRFDFTVVDTAPLASSAEAIAIAQSVTGVVVVVAADRTRIRTVKRTLEALSRVNAPVLGVVLNCEGRPTRGRWV